ncbi:MAG: hypothetical protein ACJA2G_000273 [Cognaticolwellia sp.]
MRREILGLNMLAEHFELIETIGLNLFFAFIFIFIGLSMHDVMKKNDVPKIGKIVVYFVLFLGCAGFIAKGIIQFIWESQGVG